MTELYSGPTTLREALEAASVSSTGLKLAESTPDGDWIVVQYAGGRVEIRRKHRMSGHGGSVLETGEWVATVPPNVGWRPL